MALIIDFSKVISALATGPKQKPVVVPPLFFRQGRGAEILSCGRTVSQPTTKSGSAAAHGQQTHRTTGALYGFLYEVFKGLLYHCKQKIPGLMKLIPISFLCKV